MDDRDRCTSSAANVLCGYNPLAMSDREHEVGDEPVSDADADGDWLWYVARNSDDSPRLIVRRNMSGDSWGPRVELLTRHEGWIERPELLTRFHDPGYLEPLTYQEAQAAAEAIGVPWPEPELTPAPAEGGGASG